MGELLLRMEVTSFAGIAGTISIDSSIENATTRPFRYIQLTNDDTSILSHIKRASIYNIYF